MFMKKFMIILLALTLLFGLVGCNSINLKSGYYYVGGEYEEFATPYVKLNFDDNSFAFGEGTILDYAERGSFQIKGEKITASTQNTTFIFEIKDFKNGRSPADCCLLKNAICEDSLTAVSHIGCMSNCSLNAWRSIQVPPFIRL